jgi:hypothetical protein
MLHQLELMLMSLIEIGSVMMEEILFQNMQMKVFISYRNVEVISSRTHINHSDALEASLLIS